jgi:hypothetical protein
LVFCDGIFLVGSNAWVKFQVFGFLLLFTDTILQVLDNNRWWSDTSNSPKEDKSPAPYAFFCPSSLHIPNSTLNQ